MSDLIVIFNNEIDVFPNSSMDYGLDMTDIAARCHCGHGCRVARPP